MSPQCLPEEGPLYYSSLGQAFSFLAFPFFFCEMMKSAFKISRIPDSFEFIQPLKFWNICKNGRSVTHIWFAFSTKITFKYLSFNMCTYTYAYTYVCTYVYIHIHMHTYTYTYLERENSFQDNGPNVMEVSKIQVPEAQGHQRAS